MAGFGVSPYGFSMAAVDEARTRNALGRLQIEQAQQEMGSQNALKQIIATLPEDQRPYAMMDPKGFASAQMKRLNPDPITLSEGQRFIDPKTGAVIADGGRKAPEGMQYVDGRLQPIPGYVEMRSRIAAAGREAPVSWGTWTDPTTGRTYQRSSRGQLAEMPGAGGEPMVEVYDPNSPTGTSYAPRSQAAGKPGAPPSSTRIESDGKGGFAMIQGRGAGSTFGVEQGRAGGFALRMTEAEKRIDAVVSKGYEPGSGVDKLLGKTPGGNYALSQNAQMYRQAQEDWVRAKLRLESGAAIPPDEMEAEIQTYFPQPGDKPGVIEQKRQARATAFQGVVGQSGPAYGVIAGQPGAPAGGGPATPNPAPVAPAAPPAPPPGFQIVR